MADTPFLDELALAWEEEGLFARDIDGQLVRLERATEQDYFEEVTLTIDGEEVRVKKATPLTDAQGDIVNDATGRTIPRLTTIYDAATKRYVKELGGANPIPVLCHREHMQPAAVCRVCSVEVYRQDRDGREVRGRKLLPACQHPVAPGMIVHTLNSPDAEARSRLHRSVKVLTELLAADHLHRDGRSPGADERAGGEPAPPNELETLADRMEADSTRFRFAAPPDKGEDCSSQLIAVDHNACILCNRCIRACNEVKENFVIGRAGKGYTARIGFDLDDPLGRSTCVSCGECMISCPTDALTFHHDEEVESAWFRESVRQPGNSAPSAGELQDLHTLFRVIPLKFLQWNSSSVVRRRVKHGEVLCRQGEYGATAFILREGHFAIFDESRPQRQAEPQGVLGGILGRFFAPAAAHRGASAESPARAGGEPSAKHSDASIAEHYDRLKTKYGELPAYGRLIAIRTPSDVILGEMTCMNGYARSATVVAWGECEVLEIRRNVLHMLQRNQAAREMLDRVYRERALETQLREVPLLSALEKEERDECREYLRNRVELVRVDPGQTIYRQGEPADHFYLVRLGYVKVSQTFYGQERVLNYLGPNKQFGELGLAANMPELQALIGDARLADEIWGRRTATCSALDDVELVRIRGDDFRHLVRKYPRLRDRLATAIRDALGRDTESRVAGDPPLQEFLDQGLFNGQKLLVLDLERCTRCDECTRACADTHGGVTRLIREGLRFDKYLVASACRSCQDPYCLVGCPVDAIHRDYSVEIVIEDHCIGCGLCANNCPYGNINMHPMPSKEPDPSNPRRMVNVVRHTATTCDLCRNVIGRNSTREVSCVYACPHEAAFRMSGEELYEKISR